MAKKRPPVVPVAPDECCVKCKFFMSNGPEQGVCRRFPAHPVWTGQGVLAAFPPMLNDGWCGEFAK